RPPRRYRPVPAAQVYVLAQPTAQSQLRVAWPAPAVDARSRALAALYSEYGGGGIGALVFREIREARGLAYGAWAGFAAGERRDEDAAVIAGLGTQGDKTLDALDTLLGLMARPPITAERLAIARAALEERYRSERVAPRAIGRTVQGW